MSYPPPRAALCLPLIVLTLASQATAQSAPSGSHPRIWLDAATAAGFESQASVTDGPVARGAARCSAARANPDEYSMGGWQGFEFVTTLSGCLVSWVARKDPDDLATAIKYWKVLLDDYRTVGDGAGGDDVITHDTGYAMRTFAPYSAIAYDWLHDAPGVTEELRAHARARFDAWVSFYAASGYLRNMPGANYQAGYVFAATLIAIAEAGEAGAAGDSHWEIVRDGIWGTDLAAALRPGGVLDGGDWPEGWQYGPLSVLELSLAARALAESGVPVPGIGAWTDSLVLRFAHGLTPVARKTFAAGDTSASTNHLEPTNGALIAAIAGPASEQARAWARSFHQSLGLSNENPLFDALAAARAVPAEALPDSSPTSYLARGAGNWYVRGAWAPGTVWSVFSCSRHVVDDHQHNDAGNWVLTRGGDDVVVDPSPYGTLSTLTGNAPAVDSAVLPPGYSPSQSNWGEATRLVWAKQAASGIGVARCDYADQFARSDVASDVSRAIRDFVLVPDGDDGAVVLVDRVVTGDAGRGLHLRVRTPTSLDLTGDTATGTVGGSSVVIHKVWSTSGTPSVRDMPLGPECSSDNRGTCDASRLPSGQEYLLQVGGPSAAAIHVVNAQAAGAPPRPVQLLSGAGYRGVLLDHTGAGARVAVVLDDTSGGTPPSSFSYRVPAGAVTTHVVVDAPVDADGASDVTSQLDGSDCLVVVTPHSGASGGLDGRGLVVRLTGDCVSTEEPSLPPLEPGGADGSGAAPGGTGAGGAGTGSGGAWASSGGARASSGGSLEMGPDGPTSGSGGGAVGASGAGGSGSGAEAAEADASSPELGACAVSRPNQGAPIAWLGLGVAGLLLAARRHRAPRSAR